uniref:Uncharacterized protein n=1 Tax=Hordeum vulgare subsp. vulgare TaxID=112509 RepID=A0A8I6XEQ0_HORVV
MQAAPPHVSALQPTTSPPRPMLAAGLVQDQIPSPPSSPPPQLTARGPTEVCAAMRSAPNRFASLPVTFRRPRERITADMHWTLGDFLAAATKQIAASLPTPGKRHTRHPLSFSVPRRGRSASTAKSPRAAPSTAERTAQVQVLRTLGIIGIDQRITSAEMRAYDGIFAAPIPLDVLAAMAALIDRKLPEGLCRLMSTPATTAGAGET